MTENSVKRKLTAILCADVKGYSRLMGEDEVGTFHTLSDYLEIINTIISEHSGRVFSSPGDAILAQFVSVVDAVECAVEIQEKIESKNADVPEDRKMRFRIGVNIGDVIEKEEQIYGDGVNIAARIETLAEPGRVSISKNAYRNVYNKLKFGYEYQGAHQVKNIANPVRVYKVLTESEHAGQLIGEPKAPKRLSRQSYISIFAVLALVAVTAIWYFYTRVPKIEPASVEKMAYPLPDKPSIAVLAFDNLSGDPEHDYIADGISENIITALSYIPEMFVIARNSSFTYKGKPVKIQQVSEELGVRYVLEGSILKSEEKIRVTAQLIDALTGGHIWSERYDRDMKDLFNLLDEITQSIAIALQIKLTQGEQARMWYGSTHNLEAWGYVVKTLPIFLTFTKEAMVKSRKLFEQALEIDPEYAHALTMLAWTHFIDAKFRYTDSRDDSLKRTIELAKDALALNDKDPFVHSLWQHIYLLQKQHDKAIEEGRKAIKLGPNEAEVHILFAEVLYRSGLFEESVKMCEKAMRLHPHTPFYYLGHLMSAYYWVGRYEESLALAKQHIDNGKKWGVKLFERWGYWCSARAKVMLGRENEARDDMAKFLEIVPGDSMERDRRDTIYKPEIIAIEHEVMRKAGYPEHPPLPLPDKPSIAVLAFDNMSGDPEQKYFSDGISEEIISSLSKIDKIFVIARNSSFTYKGKPVNVKQISQELGVRYILEGSVRKSEDRVRITAQLIDATTGHHLWSERYDRELKDIFALQDEITMKIVTALRIKLSEGEQARMWGKQFKNLDVQLKVMEAHSLWRKGTKESLIRHGQMAKEIVDMAPENPFGYIHLAMYNWMLAILGRSPKESIAKAFKMAQKAITLDESFAMSHAILGNVYLLMRKYEKAIAAGERSVELEPNGAIIHVLFGSTLGYAGRLDEAIGYLKQGIRLNPFPPSLYFLHLGRCYRQKGQYDEALTAFEKALHRSPDDLFNHLSLGAIYVLLDRQEEARAAAQKVLELNPKFSVERASKTWPYKNPVDLKILVDALNKTGLK